MKTLAYSYYEKTDFHLNGNYFWVGFDIRTIVGLTYYTTIENWQQQ